MDASTGHDQVSLDDMTVRPITPLERRRWEELMSEHHYLGYRQSPGEAIRYVAEWKGQWVALIGWASCALKCRPRDEWLEWSAELRRERRRFVAANVRFLVLPGLRVSNLASKVLSLNVKRLSKDWEAFHGHPVVLAETFVDPAHFKGTCYLAAGWLSLGESRGFGMNSGQYYHHGRRKKMFVYPICKDARTILASPFPSPALQSDPSASTDLNTLNLSESGGLMEVLGGVRDPRKARGKRHTQLSILAVAVCACLSGCRSLVAMGEWAGSLSQVLLRRLGCPWNDRLGRFVGPSEPTIRRTLQAADVHDVDRRIGQWLMAQAPGSRIAIDGKVLRGSKSKDGSAVHLLSAILQDEGIVIAQQRVPDKTNEIPAIKTLLGPLDVAGRTLTMDALHTQHETARYIVEEKKADYVLTVKGNQPTLLAAIEDLDDESFSPSVRND